LSEGEIISEGKYEELKERGIDFSEFILKSGNENENENNECNENVSLDSVENTIKKKVQTLKKKKERVGVKSAKELEGDSASVATQLITEEEHSKSG
jgi:hypothetical protein